jgi:hypothetical protein
MHGDSSLRRSDLSAGRSRWPSREGYSYGVTVHPLPVYYREDTPTECVQFQLSPPWVVLSGFRTVSHHVGIRRVKSVHCRLEIGPAFPEVGMRENLARTQSYRLSCLLLTYALYWVGIVPTSVICRTTSSSPLLK